MTQKDWQRLWRERDKRDRKKVNRRWVDRYYFKKVLSKEMYDRYEIHHNWLNGATCYLLTPLAHRDALTKGNRKE